MAFTPSLLKRWRSASALPVRGKLGIGKGQATDVNLAGGAINRNFIPFPENLTLYGKAFFSISISIPSAPQIQGLPIPRVTTAA
jgi:hypothetical protein